MLLRAINQAALVKSGGNSAAVHFALFTRLEIFLHIIEIPK